MKLINGQKRADFLKKENSKTSQVTAEEIKDFAGLYHVTTNWLLFGADQEEENRMQRLGAYYQLFMKLSGQEQKEVIQFMEQILSK